MNYQDLQFILKIIDRYADKICNSVVVGFLKEEIRQYYFYYQHKD